ncbi:MAG TPA: hypothetical protein VHO91_14620, partial [Rhodopila sp.]|nr:hypothetical protein [Rhodopila sp.]
KADAAARDRALKQAQEQAKAAQAQAAAAHTQATQTAAQVAAAPPPAPVPAEPKLPQGSFRVGQVTVTLGGFAAMEGLYRSRNEAASIDTSFGGIPLPNNPNYHVPEFRTTAQQSRFSLLAQADPNAYTHLASYLETDFLSAGSSSNSNQSNSYTLRLRQFFGEYDNSNLGLHVEGGQGWTLATMYSKGLLPRQENVPLTIDAQYVVGFNWARQAEVRVVKDIDQKYWFGLSVESPQTIFGNPAGPNCFTGAAAPGFPGGGIPEYAACGGPNVNSIQAYSDNYAPDLIAKVAADPGFGHYELYGLLRFMNGRVSYAATGTGTNHATTGEGIGAGMILPVVPGKLNFQVSGLIGKGVGRYGSSTLPDVTFSPNGSVEALPGYSVMGGFVGHPVPSVDIYAYGGAEGVSAKYAGAFGYGSPSLNLSGCGLELGACPANTNNIVEGTIGAWWRFIKGPWGTMQAGLQYEYLNRNTFAGSNGKGGSIAGPSANENVLLFSMRYYPFQ